MYYDRSHCTCGFISPCGGRDCVKSLRLFCMGLYPQTLSLKPPTTNPVLVEGLVTCCLSPRPKSETLPAVARTPNPKLYTPSPQTLDTTLKTPSPTPEPYTLISQKVFIKSFCKSQFPRKSVNLFFL